MRESRNAHLPRISVPDVLIDVDDTISYGKRPDYRPAEELLLVLADLVAGQESISREAAVTKIREVGNPETSCIFSFLEPLGVS